MTTASIWQSPIGSTVVMGAIIASIAELRALNSSGVTASGMDVVFVAGYYAKGDGGGGNYYLDSSDTTTVDNGGSVIVASDGGRWKLLVTTYMSPKQFGCKGDGSTDDTVNFQKFLTALPIRGVGDLVGANYKITQPMAVANIFVILQNGKFTLANDALNFFYVVTAKDFGCFYNLWFQGTGVIGTAVTPKYQGGIFSGNQDYPAPMNTVPANHVNIEDCYFDDLTIAVFAGGATGTAPPVGWNARNNRITDMVGYPGQSEGYGILYSPANSGVIKNNYFQNIRRHAIYFASEASFNLADGNIIDGCDNIAIQFNTNNSAYPVGEGNKIINNEIRGLTRSIAYGYRSSIGIGLYGKFIRTIVSGNRIYGALDTGIEASGSMGVTAYAIDLMIHDNMCVMDPAATDAGIRINDVMGFQNKNNTIRLMGAIYGIAIDLAVTASALNHECSDNSIETTNAAAIAFRTSIVPVRTVRIFRNTMHGFTDAYANMILDTPSAGVIFSDLNHRVGTVATDADFSVNQDGVIANTDASNIMHTGVLTAARTVTLVERAGELGRGRDGEITISRTGGGAFNLNVKSTTGGTLKALTTGQWGKFKRLESGVWALVSFGAL